MFGLFRSKTAAAAMPSAGPQPERYKGRPLLMLLENYILACIGALPEGGDVKLTKIVQKSLGGGDDWKQTVRERLEFNDAIDGRIREMWSRNQAIAAQRGQPLHPVQFAKLMADTNFSHLI
jgi:hypothetical protein